MKQNKEGTEIGASQVSKKRKRERSLIEKLPSAGSDYDSKFARALGSVDWHTREQGLQALTIWLTRNDVSDQDLTKIWKALFFCFWHSDKAPVQAELAERLAAMLPKLREQGALQYFKIFARTMQREWFGIDKLRLDKFMMLARKFLHQLYAHLQKSGWSPTATAAYSKFLLEEVLAPSDADPSAGFSLHIADIIVQELISVCEDSPVPPPALQALLEPCCISLARTKRAALLSRLQDSVFEPLLEEGGQPGALADLNTQQLATCLFDLGAQEGVKAKNRQICYSLSKALEKAGSARQGKDAQLAEAQPVQQNGTVKKAEKLSSNVSTEYSQEKAVSEAAPEPLTPKPRMALLKSLMKQKMVENKRNAEGRLPGKSPDLSQPKGTGQLSSGKVKKKSKLQVDTLQLPESHATPSRGTEGSQRASDLKTSKSALGNVEQEPGSFISQKEAARLVNAALDGHAGLAPSFATEKLAQDSKATTGSAMKKLKKSKKKHRQSLPAENSGATVVPHRSTASAQMSVPLGVKESPKHAQSAPAKGRGAAAPGDRLTDSQGKKVKFALKRNLYFAKGGPVPPADVRTPPTAKPKGSALKKSSVLARTPRSPKSIPRAKAALFF